MKDQGKLWLYGKLDEESSTARILGIRRFDDLRFYVSSKENIFTKLQAVDTFVKNDYEPASFTQIYFYRHTRGLLHYLHNSNLEKL